MKTKAKQVAFAVLMAVLFMGGLALAGSDWVGFPYGQMIGVPMLVVFGLIGIRLEDRHGG